MTGYDVSEWKPGDVAMVTHRDGHPQGVGIFHIYPSGQTYWQLAEHTFASRVCTAWRLVVIDPEDAEQVERLLGMWANQSTPPYGRRSLHDALREYANPTPRIVEPQGPLTDDELRCLRALITERESS